jgi:two-component system sensor histidine kinase KdpD
MTARLTSVLARHGYVTAVVAVALSTALFLLGRDAFAKGQWALLYLLVVLLIASVAGAGPAVVAAVLAFFAWNFFFLPPYHTLAVHAAEDWLSLVAFLIVSVIVGLQAGRMREREARALARERETAALNRLSATVVSSTSTEEVARTCLAEAVKVLDADVATLFVLDGDELRSYREGHGGDAEEPNEAARAREAILSAGAAPSPEAKEEAWSEEEGGLSVPVRSPVGVVGLLSVAPRPQGRAYSASEARLARSLANLVGAFLERERLQQEAALAAAEREADRLKSSLLSSVSHELKTPLAALTATVSNLLEADVDWDEKSVRDELRAIVGDVARLNNSIGALLDLSRLEAHAWEPRRELYDLGDIIAAGIDSLPAHLRDRVTVDLGDDTPVVEVDFVQWTRVIQNLLENAFLYAGDGAVTVGARGWNEGVRVWVEDRGPGIPASEHEAVFEKFYRGRGSGGRAPSGTGLGLAIAREIVRSHGGSIHVEDASPGGARFVIALSSRGEDPSREAP